MKKSLKTIGVIVIIVVLVIGAYLLGTTRAETIKEIKTVTKVQTVTETVEVVPDGYIKLEECIPLSDVACYFIDGYDYPCFELMDVGNQLDDPNNMSYEDIMENLPDETEEFRNNFVDMRTVVNFSATEYGLQLYFDDGSGYYLEK